MIKPTSLFEMNYSTGGNFKNQKKVWGFEGRNEFLFKNHDEIKNSFLIQNLELLFLAQNFRKKKRCCQPSSPSWPSFLQTLEAICSTQVWCSPRTESLKENTKPCITIQVEEGQKIIWDKIKNQVEERPEAIALSARDDLLSIVSLMAEVSDDFLLEKFDHILS